MPILLPGWSLVQRWTRTAYTLGLPVSYTTSWAFARAGSTKRSAMEQQRRKTTVCMAGRFRLLVRASGS